MARVVIDNFSKTFIGAKGEKICAVRNLSLTVEDKEFLVLVGPSGCGKTTTLRMIAGLEDVSQGTISIDGQVINAVEPKDRDIAMVFQNYALYPHMTVFENMAFGLKLRKFSKPEIEQRVRETAEILGLTPFLDRKPQALSGGQRQRVAVGRAIVRKPKVFLFDEPLSNLDVPLRAQMRSELAKLHTRLKATMIYVTHDQVEAMTMGDRIAVMKEGVIQQVAVPIALCQSPANLFVAGFIGSRPMNFFKVTLLEKGAELCFVEESGAGEGSSQSFTIALDGELATRLAAYRGKNLIVGLRPENISLSAESGTASNIANTIAAKVEVIEPMGSESYVRLSTVAHAFTARLPARERLKPNQMISCVFDMEEAHFFDPASELAIV